MLMIRRNYPINLFDILFNDMLETPSTNTMAKIPNYDVIETDKEYRIDMMFAGFKKENINIDNENNELKITAERKEINDLKYNRKETYYGKYEKSFVLPDNVDAENINASFVDGILCLEIPKIVSDTKLSKRMIEIM